MWPRVDSLRVLELGSSPELRDQMREQVTSGSKTAAARLLVSYGEEFEEVEHVGEALALVDGEGRRVAVVEVDEVLVCDLASVTDDYVHAEGEDFSDAGEWRAERARQWAESGTEVVDATEVVCLRFHALSSQDADALVAGRSDDELAEAEAEADVRAAGQDSARAGRNIPAPPMHG